MYCTWNIVTINYKIRRYGHVMSCHDSHPTAFGPQNNLSALLYGPYFIWQLSLVNSHCLAKLTKPWHAMSSMFVGCDTWLWGKGKHCKNLISAEIYWTTTHWPWLKGNWNGSKCCAAWHERWCEWRVMQLSDKIMLLYIGSASEIALMMNNI